MKTVTVVFGDGNSSKYDYLVDDATQVAKGDVAVVHTGARNGFKFVVVADVRSGVSKNATKTLVAVLNEAVRDSYDKRNAEVTKKRELFERLDQLVELEYENNKYRVLAAINPEAAKLIAELGM
jgi:hypothetical protein